MGKIEFEDRTKQPESKAELVCSDILNCVSMMKIQYGDTVEDIYCALLATAKVISLLEKSNGSTKNLEDLKEQAVNLGENVFKNIEDSGVLEEVKNYRAQSIKNKE